MSSVCDPWPGKTNAVLLGFKFIAALRIYGVEVIGSVGREQLSFLNANEPCATRLV
jgi:hypothetical protein